MRPQRALLVVLAVLLVAIGGVLVLLLRGPSAPGPGTVAHEAEPAPRKPTPSEETKSTDASSSATRASAPTAKHKASEDEEPLPPPGPPVKIFGAITDRNGHPLADVQVLVYDSFAEMHKPEVLGTGRYECTIHRAGRTLVVAESDECCRIEIPFEVMDHDEQRNIDLVLEPRETIGVHLRDLEDHPLPRFAKGQPLRAELRAVATIEELPPGLPAHCAAALHAQDERTHLGWGIFRRDSLRDRIEASLNDQFEETNARAAKDTAAALPAGKKKRASRALRRSMPAEMRRGLDLLDEAEFEQGIEVLRQVYQRQVAEGGVPEGTSTDRAFLAALGYVDENGQPIEGPSPVRDQIGTLALERPLPLRVSLLAGDEVIASRELVPTTHDVTFRVDFERLATSYVHAYVFVGDAKTGARVPGLCANLHVDPLPNGPQETLDSTGRQRPRGKPVYDAAATPAGWRTPDGDVITDATGRADFVAATPGWWRLTLKDKTHVPLSKWIYVPDQPEVNLGMIEVAPLATSTLHVQDAAGEAVHARFSVLPLLHAKDRAGVLEQWEFESDDEGQLVLADVGLQALLLRSRGPGWTIEPTVLDNGEAHVKQAVLPALRSRHVLVHLPSKLPWSAIVNIVTGFNQPVYQERFDGNTLIDLWVPAGSYTLQVIEEPTELLTTKFEVANRPLLVELVR